MESRKRTSYEWICMYVWNKSPVGRMKLDKMWRRAEQLVYDTRKIRHDMK